VQRPAGLKVTRVHETERIDCALCRNIASEFFADGQRVYLRCRTCGLIFLHPVCRPTALAETLRYQQHRNDAGDERYLAFLRRLAHPLAQSLRPGARGLDFGCGPVPALAQLLTEAGFSTASYDPLFHPDEILLDARYDFVACCEVIEHVHDPRALLERFTTLLRDGGVLGVMTRFHGESPFHRWWYRRDPTHVCFYSEETMRWIAAARGWSVRFPAAHVAIFQVCALR
jgi:SAM-dependent methyltransferase